MRRVTHINKQLVQTKVLEGIADLANFVAVTLGPAGRPVMIEKDDGKVLITKDGVTCSKFHESDDPIKHLVATAAREACERTVRKAGDGTTTAIVLAHSFVQAGQEFLNANPGYSPQLLSRQLKEIFENEIKPQLTALTRPIKGLDFEQAKIAVGHIAMVSANHDAEIANAVTEAVEYVGEDGMVVAEEGAGAKTTVVHQDGFPITAGLSDLGGSAASAFVNRTSTSDCILDGSHVAMYDGEIADIETILPLLQRVSMAVDENGHSVRNPILIVAHSFSNNVLKMLAQNFRKGVISSVPFITPRSGQSHSKQQFLHDLAAYVGGTVFEPQGNKLQDAHISQLGFIERAKIGQNDTVLFTDPEVEQVEKRIAELKSQMDEASEFDKDRIRYRIGQLTGGVAIIYAGGATAVEAKERHDRVVDAVSAVRSAMEMGVLPGGGAALAAIGHTSLGLMTDAAYNPRSIFFSAIQKPFVQILDNAGFLKAPEALPQYLEQIGTHYDHTVEDNSFYVINAMTNTKEEWYASGIMDPLKVTLSALESALSVAQLLMTLGGVVVHQTSEGEQQVKAMQEGLLKAVHADVLD